MFSLLCIVFYVKWKQFLWCLLLCFVVFMITCMAVILFLQDTHICTSECYERRRCTVWAMTCWKMTLFYSSDVKTWSTLQPWPWTKITWSNMTRRLVRSRARSSGGSPVTTTVLMRPSLPTTSCWSLRSARSSCSECSRCHPSSST